MLSRRLLPRFHQTAKSLSRAVSSKAQTGVSAPQAPNHPTTWSSSQQPRPAAGLGPRFEQTAMELQPNPLSAMELIDREPIRMVNGRKAVCDGGTLCLYSFHWP
jgi:NADH dehydrogenase (ubiquinone) Fe-S protein 6